MRVKLPENATAKQIEIYNKNCDLFIKAYEKRNRFGVLLSYLGDFGIQDYWDEDAFINIYPFNGYWYTLVYGKEEYSTTLTSSN
jgi:hypothetical protein